MSFMTGWILGNTAAKSAAHTQETVLHFQRLRQNRRTACTVASWQQHAAEWEASARHLDAQLTIAEGMLQEAAQHLQQAAADRQALEERLARAEALATGWETSARQYHSRAIELEVQVSDLRQELSVHEAILRATTELSKRDALRQTN
ncbi:hypothetical protein ACFQY5_40275 [Paeniroseomonas aquatica]|uniref:Uncharacterized protein n=1 Tax=Paeniroseomonas aquatica TaxID=373043 RepID=A0ABT8A033_9PROT|nr:hypothetical protein [Paeniroseomonas aquatica]MDN3563082.1 hypothetical protein [Paeniroseomonas aquatica]